MHSNDVAITLAQCNICIKFFVILSRCFETYIDEVYVCKDAFERKAESCDVYAYITYNVFCISCQTQPSVTCVFLTC